MKAKLESSQVASFILGGKSIFTVRNVVTGNRFTYKLTRKKSLKEGDDDVVFVKVLSRPDNTSDYTFIGTIFGGTTYKHSPKSPFGSDAMSSKAIDWLVRNAKSLPENVEVWHEGKCARCGRKLTVPESIQSGFGPECSKMR
jgi:hypothetical protein